MDNREDWMDDPDHILTAIQRDAMLHRARGLALSIICADVANDEGLPGSWLGGRPSLPQEEAWPNLCDTNDPPLPLHFIAQFNLAYFPQFDKPPMLPARGMLYFFYSPITLGDGGGKVIYLPDANHHHPLRSMPEISSEYHDELSRATEGCPLEKNKRYYVEKTLVCDLYDWQYINNTNFLKEVSKINNDNSVIKNNSGFIFFGNFHDWGERRSKGKENIGETRLLTISSSNILQIRTDSAPSMAFTIKNNDLISENFDNVKMEENSN